MKSKLNILITLFLVLSTTVFALDKEVVSITLLNGKQSSETNATEIIINITNNSEKSIKVLKRNTPLEDTLRADMFNVSIDNKKVPYVGMKVKRGAPTEEDYIIFQPKETKTISLDISNYYKMDSSGIYTISYKGSVEFSLEDDNNAFKANGELDLKKLKPTVNSMNLEFVASEKNYTSEQTPNFDGCTNSQITAINTAYTSAVQLANIASTDMNNANRPTSAARYSEWFGSANTTRHDIVKTNFAKIYSALDSEQINFSCSGGNSCQSDTYAYVLADQPYKIYLCNQFWNASLTGTDSRAGTIIHETSHFAAVAGTDHVVYTQANARNLALSYPNSAVQNANSYEFFAENTPSLDMDDAISRSRSGYTISGYIRNGATGVAIDNASLSLYSGQTTTTDSSGHYVFDGLAPGSYTLSVSAPGYIRDSLPFTISTQNIVRNMNILELSVSTDYKVVLSWGATPEDLDSHLIIANSNGEGCMDEVYFYDKDALPYASLDVDDRHRYGPETVTIFKFVGNKDHEYWLTHYSGNHNFAISDAVVRVYRGSRLVKTYRVPANTGSKYWHVFDIGVSGIKTVNTFHDTKVGRCQSRYHVPETPTNIKASDGLYPNFVFLNNYSVFGATKYKIYRADSFISSPIFLGATYNGSFKDLTAEPKKFYYYAIKACNSNGCSDLSNYDRGYRKRPVIPATPTSIKASDGTYNDFIFLTDYAVFGATKYRIYRTDSFGAPLKYLGATYYKRFKDFTAEVGKSYYYSIRACNGNGCSALSSYDRGYRKRPVIPATPTSIKASDGIFNDFIFLTDYAVFGATKYRIYRADSFSAPLKYLGATYYKRFKDFTAEVGKSYYYSIRACNGNGCSALSSYDGGYRKRPVIPATPTTIQASDGTFENFVYLDSYGVFGATKYRIYRADSFNAPLKYLGATYNKSFKDLTAEVGKSYYYSIRACNGNGCSASSSYDGGCRKRPVIPATPTTIQASDGTFENFVYLDSYGVFGATKYRIYRADSFNAPLKYLGATYSKTFKDLTAVAGQSYYYSIRACNSNGCSALSNYNKGYLLN